MKSLLLIIGLLTYVTQQPKVGITEQQWEIAQKYQHYNKVRYGVEKVEYSWEIKHSHHMKEHLQ